jgi:site-specific DNA-methyltransferase (adenine-specific)
MTALVADKDKHQWFTPTWAGQILFREHFSDLGGDDLVIEPTCGIGTFLNAVPRDIPAIGVEIDPVLASIARRSTGREVLTGDFTEMDFDGRRPTAVIGNPPFVVKYARRWSLEQDMIPRNLFKEMQKPLCFAVLTKDSGGRMRGFSLYRELHDVNSMKSWVVDELSAGRSPWKTVVAQAIEDLGGRAKLQDIYAAVAPRRPTGNNWWQAKVRQTLARSGAFTRVGESEYMVAQDSLRAAA